jgi:hypothetical protein
MRSAVAILALVFLICAFTIGGRAAAQDGDANLPLEPVTSQSQTWSVDAYIVAYANTALTEYAGFSSGQQRKLATSALEIAKLRRNALGRLIQADPSQAILLSLSPVQRQGLPKLVLDLLELRVHAVGDLIQAVSENLPGDSQGGLEIGTPEPPGISWTARIGQTTRHAFVYGLRLRHQTKFKTPIHGIAIDNVMAIDESPLYQYDPFETVELGFLPGEIVATSGDLPILLRDIGAFQKLRQEIIEQQLLRFGPLLDLFAWSRGAKRVLVIKADLADRTGVLYTDAQITSALEETSEFFVENSQGQTSLTPTILPAVLRLPSNSAVYAAMGTRLGPVAIREDAFEQARRFDAAHGGSGAYEPNAYDRVLVLTPQVFMDSNASGDLNGRAVVVTGTRLVLHALAHEFGHTYGFIHSNFWLVPYGADPIGPGSEAEYGDMWDMMGLPTLDMTDMEPRRRHFNAFFKSLAGWLPAAAIANATAGGSFRLYRHDSADASGLRAIWIDGGPGKNYWLDMRRNFPWNPSMSNGIEVRRVLKDADFVYGPVQLLDMDHVTIGPGGSVLHSLVRLRSFEDAPSGITIRVGGVSSDTVGEFADVVVTR